MSWPQVADTLAAVLLLLGAFLTLAAGVGIVRFPDLLARMHAATKPQVLGLILMLTAEGLRVRSWSVVGVLVLIMAFQLLTAPIAAHIVGRAGFRTGQMKNGLLVVDELSEDQEEASRQVAAAIESNPALPGIMADKFIERTAQIRNQPGMETVDFPIVLSDDPQSPDQDNA
ncbi:monovalent cation/H(+) antiporter subunit G [Jonesiaceae bacterium BS-20]|uniref:Monovalent cation/H(+) antiporter subunit G n=1 Tax=Jonesiaceae bacterium BS-20 TaxID=3120821 RepID=A0AAU7DUD3_9MICO